MAWYRNRYFDEMVIYDADANPYRISAVRLVKPSPAWETLILRLTNGRMEVILELERTGNASLDNAEATTIAWLNRAPDFWEAGRSLEEWRGVIAAARGMDELCESFA